MPTTSLTTGNSVGKADANRMAGEPGLAQDRVMLEWARQRPNDGFVIGVALRVQGPRPTPERLAALVTARMAQVPVLAECLDGPLREERWRPADGFDIGRHVHVLNGAIDLHRTAELLANQPLGDDRPGWGLWLTGTGRDDEYLLAYRVHHAAQDGAAVAHTISRLFDARVPEPASEKSSKAVDRQWATTPPPPRKQSRLLATADVPVEALRTISRASGASLNDIYLAALAGSLRAWLPRAERGRPVPVRVPFNLRLRQDRQDRGNRCGLMRILLPVEERGADRRLARIIEQTSSWPRDRTRKVMDNMPHHLFWKNFSISLSPEDALGSATLLGVHTPLAVGGAPVTAGLALPPLLSGHLFSSVLFLYGTRAAFSVTARTQHQHVRDLPHLWERELAELATATRA
ncbi:wax ester/triacylglycerol synthase domain-containing protein [Streptomyces sp. NPDC001513]|uniref:wax ester/triacylglycerol synthase domain-containing protein n=1 Tax=Streptomyces sp. NPDC001513 TaxID=3364580 RepID=UPI00369AFE51